LFVDARGWFGGNGDVVTVHRGNIDPVDSFDE
jgi:hypothetical protein